MFRKTLPLQIGVVIIALLIVAVIIAGPHLAKWAESLLEWVESLGHFGPLAMIGGYAAVCTFSVPGAPLTLGCGFLFGVVKGTVIATIGSTIGATVAFLIARFGGRGFFRAKVGKRIRFRRLDRAARHHGFTIVLLTRMSPLFPFNLLNYVFGFTSVHFKDYILATMIGVVPVSILYVYVGSLMKTLAQVATGKVDPAALQPWVIVTPLILTVAAVALLATIAKRLLEKALRAEERPSAGVSTNGRAPGADLPQGEGSAREFDIFEHDSREGGEMGGTRGRGEQ